MVSAACQTYIANGVYYKVKSVDIETSRSLNRPIEYTINCYNVFRDLVNSRHRDFPIALNSLTALKSPVAMKSPVALKSPVAMKSPNANSPRNCAREMLWNQ
jgi:hypothetical protein